MSFQYPQTFWLLWFEDDGPNGEGDGHFMHFSEASAVEAAKDCAGECDKACGVLRCVVSLVGVAEPRESDYIATPT